MRRAFYRVSSKLELHHLEFLCLRQDFSSGIRVTDHPADSRILLSLSFVSFDYIMLLSGGISFHVYYFKRMCSNCGTLH